MKNLLLFGLLLTGCAPKDHWPQKILCPKEPIQQDLPPKTKGWSHPKGYLITPLARFEVTARVLLTERFSTGREADLSPEDLCLGWGEMSNGAYLSQIKLAHVERYYQWQIQGEVPDKDTITAHSANMHIIPANPNVAAVLKSIRVHDLVHFQGSLVSVTAPDGWSWNSSLVRTDSGTGACELVWVEKLEKLLTPP